MIISAYGIAKAIGLKSARADGGEGLACWFRRRAETIFAAKNAARRK